MSVRFDSHSKFSSRKFLLPVVTLLRSSLEKVCHFVGVAFLCFQQLTAEITLHGVTLNLAAEGPSLAAEFFQRQQVNVSGWFAEAESRCAARKELFWHGGLSFGDPHSPVGLRRGRC